MEPFAGAWSGFENASIEGNSPGIFLFPNAPQSQIAQAENERWDGFMESLPNDHSNTLSGFDAFSDLSSATQATAGAVSTTAGLPYGAQLPTPLSSDTSCTIAPPHSALQAARQWPATNAPVANFRYLTSYPAGPSQPIACANNLAHEGLRIHVPPPPQHFGLHQRHLGSPSPYYGSPQSSTGDFGRDAPSNHREASFFSDAGDDEGDSDDATDVCYAKLLYKCLKEAPGHTMTLKELYEWISSRSRKATDSRSRGWQNSVRHNLSMNAAFERVQSDHGAKKGSLWRVTAKALAEGVISTTRYRKDPKRKSERKGPAAFKRQQSGARGGQATRAATRRNREMMNVRSTPYSAAIERRPIYQRENYDGVASPASMHSPWSPADLEMLPATAPASPYFFGNDNGYLSQQPTSNSMTPPQLQLSYESEAKPALHNFELRHIDLAKGSLFGDHDSPLPDTPSWATEASWTDDGMSGLLPHDGFQEATLF